MLTGCAPQKQITHERNLGIDAVLARVRQRNEAIHTLTGNGSISVESPEQSASGSFDLMLRKPDSVLVEIHGPFGIHAATLALNRQQFVFFNRMQNVAFIGAPDGKTINSLFRLNMQFDEILDAFTGEFPLAVNPDSLVRFDVENGLYVATYKDHGQVREYHIDGDAFLITAYRLVDAEGKAIVTAMASRTDESGAIPMPRLLRVIFPAEHRSITVAYSDLHLNDSVSCGFTLPADVQKEYR
ncbi:MAG TPA: DUF4292 domain-containing protein [Bacteroidota bacterium]|nr:DUF4292 domain-containing protein [Bacteroidota bacterium]